MAVAVMALTGLLNSIFMVGSFRALLTSAYGQLLVSKLILFFVMVGFGAWNLFLLKPRLAVDLPNMNVADQKSAIRSLLWNVLCEVGLGAAVILIVAALGITPPPLH
jgi:putative copper resistance protein D